MTSDDHEKVFAAGQEAGRVAQILVEHAAHFAKINGSIDKSVEALHELASEVRGLREDMRLGEERVEVAATVLAEETERRRRELAGTAEQQDREVRSSETKLSRRERVGGVVITALLAALGYLLGR